MPNTALTTLLAKAAKAAERSRGKLVFGFDATASRGTTWETARELQTSMMGTIRNLEIQLAVFRGDELLISGWETDPTALQALMAQINTMGGNTQIIRLLQHILDESARGGTRPINAFVFIGDTFEEDPATAKARCAALGTLKIPGFFFLENTAYGRTDAPPMHEPLYKEMARLTGGAYARFDGNSAKFLSDLLEGVAAFAAGGLTALSNKNSDAARLLLTQMKRD